MNDSQICEHFYEKTRFAQDEELAIKDVELNQQELTNIHTKLDDAIAAEMAFQSHLPHVFKLKNAKTPTVITTTLNRDEELEHIRRNMKANIADSDNHIVYSAENLNKAIRANVKAIKMKPFYANKRKNRLKFLYIPHVSTYWSWERTLEIEREKRKEALKKAVLERDESLDTET